MKLSKAILKRTRSLRERLARFISPELSEEADSAGEPYVDGGDWVPAAQAKNWIDFAAGRAALGASHDE